VPNQAATPEQKQDQKPSKAGKSPFRPINAARRTAGLASEFNRESTAPLDPMVGTLPQVGSDGTLSASGGPGNPAQVRVEPGKILRQSGEFAYRLSGVVVGNASAVVLQDDSGKQRLVRQGGSIDGESRVVSIDRNAVVVRHNGKNITLKLGGSPETK